MLALILIDEKQIADDVIESLRANDIEAVRCRDPIRLIDSVAEMDPDVVIVRQIDFPLHTHMIAAYTRFYAPLQHCKIYALSDEPLDMPNAKPIAEKEFTEHRTIFPQLILGVPKNPSHKGSRLVARAQNMVKE